MTINDKILALPPISQVLKDKGFYTKKNLGQNFIFDLNLTTKIARLAGDVSNDIVIEIGGGAGSLTRPILMLHPKKFIVIEKDARSVEILKELAEISEGKLELLNEDATKIDYEKLIKPEFSKAHIIANLPYNVGTDLLLSWFENIENFASFTLMFQKEVAQRICASVGDDAYGRLAILSTLLCKAHISFEVPPSAFFPPPKVYSAVVRILPHAKPLYDVDIQKLKTITRAAFSQKRKMIRNTLQPIFPDNIEEVLNQCGIKPTDRAEHISPEQYAKLTKFI